MKTEKIIKEVTTHRYQVKLVELNNTYVVEYTSNLVQGVNHSEPVNNYNLAAFLFDLKIEELEGN